jgi:predicted lipoprotein with Yx(FWY)xxD motif
VRRPLNSRSSLVPATGDAARGALEGKRRVLGIVVMAGGIALAACGSSGSTSSSTSSTQGGSAASSASAAVVKTASDPSLGTILVDSRGFTLYTLTNGGRPIPCNTACTAVWPPLLAPPGTAAPTGAAGVGQLGKSASGKVVTYKGFPLFLFSGDTAAGQTNGKGISSFGGVWNPIKAGSTPGT